MFEHASTSHRTKETLLPDAREKSLWQQIQHHLPSLLLAVLVLGSASLLMSRQSWAAEARTLTQTEQTENLATVFPVAHLLSRALLADTGVQVDYLPSKRYPVSRIGYWIDKKLPEELSDMPAYQAVAEVASIWPQGAVYPTLRQRNIGVIPVDFAVQIKPAGARISRSADEQALDFFWLNSANLKMMTAILADDFARIWPQHQAVIQRNQQQALNAITAYALKLDETLWQQGWDGVCSEDEALQPMLQSLSLPLLAKDKTEDLTGFRCLWIEEGKKQDADQAKDTWTLNGLNRFEKANLALWLEDNLKRLERVPR